MAKLYCAVLLVVGWSLALAATNPPTAQEKLDKCQNITKNYHFGNFRVLESNDTPCRYNCISTDTAIGFIELTQIFPDGVDCGQGNECNSGNCVDKRAIEICETKMPGYTRVDNDKSCFIACTKGNMTNYFQAPTNYTCQPPLPCATKNPTACDDKGRCIPVRDDVTDNAQNYPRNNNARAFMDCATRYKNGEEQYKKKNMELTSASANKYWCSYTCEFNNMTDKSVVKEDYCFADATNCTNTTDPLAEEKVCVSGWCQSKTLYDKCMAKGVVPQIMGADDCVTLMCNNVDITYAAQGKTCMDYKNNTQTCDGKGSCGKPFQWN